MSTTLRRHVYGPVPSRRLGRSLGIDLVPHKTCTYDCVYCQLGRTPLTTIERREYVPLGEVIPQLRQKLDSGSVPDYISLAGSGEPTLHAGIGDLIRAIKTMTRIPVAVLTNGSLLWRRDVQDALMGADLVLPSLDAGDEHRFQRVNRPHGEIDFHRMVDGLATFTKRFDGEVWLEVFLVEGQTGTPEEVRKIADLVARIAPARVQLNTVTRPPAEPLAHPVTEEQLTRLAALFTGRVEIITDYPVGGRPSDVLCAATSEDILVVLGRRPCTAEDLSMGLGLPLPEVIKYLDELSATRQVSPVITGGRCYYKVADSGLMS
ncbi:MAG: radical SAM protein [Vicinamibacterales bacterium]|nr:radical SAM protein [Vicinamibacterales bacterium]